MPEIYDMRMHDGSRHFAALPMTRSWHTLHAHLKRLGGVSDTSILTDEVTEAWIDFRYRGHQFSVNNQLGEYWFFVEDPACPFEVLEAVLTHCKLLLVNCYSKANDTRRKGRATVESKSLRHT